MQVVKRTYGILKRKFLQDMRLSIIKKAIDFSIKYLRILRVLVSGN